MSETKKISIGLPMELIEAADAAVANGDFQSIEHVVLTALEQWKQDRARAIETLEASVQEGIDSGFVEGGFDMEEIKRAGREALAANRA